MMVGARPQIGGEAKGQFSFGGFGVGGASSTGAKGSAKRRRFRTEAKGTSCSLTDGKPRVATEIAIEGQGSSDTQFICVETKEVVELKFTALSGVMRVLVSE